MSENAKINTIGLSSASCLIQAYNQAYSHIYKTNGEGEFRKTLWFRGSTDCGHKLSPGAHREFYRHPRRPNESSPNEEKRVRKWRTIETDRTQKFLHEAPARLRGAPDIMDRPAWLSLMQHYSLPTRLLDWTESFLFATFVALRYGENQEGTPSTDAVIWALAPGIFNSTEGYGDLVWSLNDLKSVRDGDEIKKRKTLGRTRREDQISFRRAVRLRRLVDESFEAGRRGTGAAAVYPSEIDTRLFIQQGRFTIHGVRSDINQDPLPDLPIQYKDRSHTYLVRIRIPRTCQMLFSKELKRLGLRKSTYFPDLTALAQELTAGGTDKSACQWS